MKIQSLFPLLLCFFANSFLGFSQKSDFFALQNQANLAAKNTNERTDFPLDFQVYSLDLEAFKTELSDAPLEFTQAAKNGAKTILLPLADGQKRDFTIWQTAMMAPELAAKFPEIKTFAGCSLDAENPATFRMTISARGLHVAIVKADKGVDYIETYAQGLTEIYIVYDRKNLPSTREKSLQRQVLGDEIPEILENIERFVPENETNERGNAVPVELKIYRFAVATTGEFAQDNGGTKPLVLAKVVEVTNQLSGIYEREMNIRLQLVANNETIIFLDPNTDQFFGFEVGDWMGQNPQVLNTYIGLVNYDLGHVYARYITGGAIGVAGGLGNICGASKGAGCSGGNGDYGDFFVNVVGQETGHQMGGGHTWNRCGGGGGRHGLSAFEPGSGTTIMSYAGSCGSDNVQNNSDLYFHAGSCEEIRSVVDFGSGASCGTTIPTTNNHPEVSLPYQDGFFIPISTPFELNGSATDPDGDALVYIWEQMDIGPEVSLQTPEANSPLFRTWPSVTKTNRYFPNLETVINNAFDVTEQLPTYSRDMTFRLTARDHVENGGGYHWKDVAFKAYDGAGPFRVQYPNAASDILEIGTYTQIKWAVANSDKAPVNCANVNIRLSTDGGLTYPTVLASNVANDGSHFLIVPNMPTTKGRLRVDAADNVFYDISNANFKIQQPASPSLTMGLATDSKQICLPNTFSSEILTAGVLGFNEVISLSFGNLPIGVTGEFAQNSIQSGENSTFSVDFSNFTQEGTFQFEVVAIAPNDTTRLPISITTVSNDFSQFGLITPTDGLTGAAQVQTLRWTKVADANFYDVQVATNPSFNSGTLVATKTATALDSFRIPVLLEKNKAYFWRVRPSNECGTHDWAATNFFSTLVENCQTAGANDLPRNITTNGTPTVESKITINSPGTISDINIKNIRFTHDEMGQLEATLTSPAGTNITLFQNRCGVISVFNTNFSLDDNAAGAFPCPPPTSGTSFKPQNPLNVLNGQSVTGDWKFKLKDNASGAGGTFQAWTLEYCSSVSLNPPFLIINNPLSLPSGTNAFITNVLLKVDDPNNTAAQLTFTMVTQPIYGRLQKGNQPLVAGDQFSQADIDNGQIRYFDYGFNLSGEDDFKFMVTDSEGGYFGSPRFIINPGPVSSEEPQRDLSFVVFPNPSTGLLNISLDKVTDSETQIQIFNAAGMLVAEHILAKGQAQIAFSLEAADGLYFLMLRNGNDLKAGKFLLKK